MRYDYICKHCNKIFEIEKKMSDPDPKSCPLCGSSSIERYFDSKYIPFITYKNRPTWTYNDCKKYKECSFNGGPRIKIDPSKHGDIGSWNCSGEICKKE
jgi:putative FmdB family regulatory protein